MVCYDSAWVVPPIEVRRAGVDGRNSAGRVGVDAGNSAGAVWDAGRVMRLQRWQRVTNRLVRWHREWMIGDAVAGNCVGVGVDARNVGTSGWREEGRRVDVLSNVTEVVAVGDGIVETVDAAML